MHSDFWVTGVMQPTRRETVCTLMFHPSCLQETGICCIGCVWEQTTGVLGCDCDTVVCEITVQVRQKVLFCAGGRQRGERCPPLPPPLHVWFQALLRCGVFRRWWKRKHGMRLRRVRRRKGWWEGFPSKSRRAAGGSRGERTRLCSDGCSVEEKRKKKKNTTGWARGRGEKGA